MSCPRTQHGDVCGDRNQDLDSESDALPLRHRAPWWMVVQVQPPIHINLFGLVGWLYLKHFLDVTTT